MKPTTTAAAAKISPIEMVGLGAYVVMTLGLVVSAAIVIASGDDGTITSPSSLVRDIAFITGFVTFGIAGFWAVAQRLFADTAITILICIGLIIVHTGAIVGIVQARERILIESVSWHLIQTCLVIGSIAAIGGTLHIEIADSSRWHVALRWALVSGVALTSIGIAMYFLQDKGMVSALILLSVGCMATTSAYSCLRFVI